MTHSTEQAADKNSFSKMALDDNDIKTEDIMEEEDEFDEEEDDSSDNEENFEALEADRVYVLMKKDYRLSRNSRAKWYLKHLIPRTPRSKDASSSDRGDDFRVGRFESIDDMAR